MNQSKPNKTYTLTLNPEQAAFLTLVFGALHGGLHSYLDVIFADNKEQDLFGQLRKQGWRDKYGRFDTHPIYQRLVGNSRLCMNRADEIKDLAIEMGYAEKPTPARPNKRRMPDGKFANANYRIVKYPEHGTGVLVERHILMGDIAGDNVFVKEWDGKQWNPKTYKLSKLRG